ncbi:MAG: RDD family protein [Synechococcales cyanobacterium T60_A2020_003]|nr:RDD family protein [Synechococcales cyanobacterium T60_A2020_003]
MRWLKTIEVVTPEQVGLQFTLAGIGERSYAMAIDVAILLGVWTAAATLYSIFAIQLLNGLSNTNITYGQLPIWLGAIALLATFILFSGYFVFFEVTWQGQTPGKRVANIRVIRDDGRPIGLAQAVLRSLLLSFDGIPLFLGVIFILFEKREKRLGDIVAGTLVVQEEKPIAKANVTLSDRANTLAQDLPQSANLSLLLPDDFATIREYLERRSRMDRDARRELSLNLARQMRSRIEMESIPTGLTSDEFLEAVYIAYQKQFGGV